MCTSLLLEALVTGFIEAEDYEDLPIPRFENAHDYVVLALSFVQLTFIHYVFLVLHALVVCCRPSFKTSCFMEDW
jgi:hypothetical protein